VLLPAAGTTTPLVNVGAGRVGTGRVNLQNAVASQVIAYNADEPGLVGVSFGAPEAAQVLTLTKNVKVVNKGNTAASYTLGYIAGSDVPGVTFSYPATVDIPANSSVTIPVQMTATPTAMKHTRDVTVSATQGSFAAPNNARQWLSEESGVLTFTPVTGTPLRLSLYAAPRPAATMGTTQTFIPFTTPTGTVTVNAAGTSVETGTSYPTDVISLVKPLELQFTSPDEPTSTGLGNSADLKYVGVNSDFRNRSGSIGNTTLSFGIATYSPWSNPIQVSFNILIDTNRDGVDDYLVNNLTLSGTDVTVATFRTPPSNTSASFRFAINGQPASSFDTGAFNSSVMVLPVRASDLGITTAANSRFNYRVQTFQRGVLIDQTPTLSYDLAAPGLDTSSTSLEPFIYFDRPATSFPVAYNSPAYAANQSQGLLLLHLHNQTPAQAQVLPVGLQPQAIRAKSWQLVGSADFNGDGQNDLVWRNYVTGANEVWLMNGYSYQSTAALPSVGDLSWQLAAVGDFTKDGKPDLVWRNFVTGVNAIWQMNGTTYVNSFFIGNLTDLNWQIAGTGDLTKDGNPDLIWRNYKTGETYGWQMDAYTYVSTLPIATVSDLNWVLAGTGDLTNDGKPDLLWRNYTTGQIALWQMDGNSAVGFLFIDTVADPAWQLIGANDFTNDGKPDLIWRNSTTGENGIWQMDGTTFIGAISFSTYPAN